ncbi:hypothetical protein D3C73_1624040 [compost metagenome]
MGEGFRKNGVYYDAANEEDLEFAKQLITNWTDPDTKTEQLLMPDAREKAADEAENGTKETNEKESAETSAQAK